MPHFRWPAYQHTHAIVSQGSATTLCLCPLGPFTTLALQVANLLLMLCLLCARPGIHTQLCCCMKANNTGQQQSRGSSQDSQEQQQAGDSIVRSAVKGLVWRIFSTTVTVGVAMVVLHDSLQVSDAVKFGGIEFVVKYITYFLHERAWAAVALL